MKNRASLDKIIILSPEVAKKIAAGEVIERPFSVVRELVDNSLDAGASEVSVVVDEGGKKRIKVVDNGTGMSRKDALLCFERHSTSKISQEDDLIRISTLGFRGEALPSLSAVSRMILKTSQRRGKKGIMVEREGEKLLKTSDIAFPQGTSVEVRDLFFNLPARKKFLRSDRSELSLIVKFLIGVSLARPEVRFSLHHGKRLVFSYPPVLTLKERIYQVYGKSTLENLMEVDHAEEGSQLNGFVSRPPSGRRDRGRQLFFVNRRPVRDRMIQASLNQTMKRYLEKDHFAEAILFISVPFSEVDVNVHPAKAEVRFRESQAVFSLVQRGMERAVLKEAGVKDVYPSIQREKKSFRVSEDAPSSVFRPAEAGFRAQKSIFPVPADNAGKKYPHILGQYLDTYIVALDKEGILIIDQHNAHERVLFERYQEIDRERKWPRKMPLLPILLEFSPSQVLSFERNSPLLEEAGFRVESMGGRSFALKEYPDILKEEEAREILLSILEEMKEEKIIERKKVLLATLACRTAVKAGESLPMARMNYLVEELFKTRDHALCPHGRPILLRLERERIEKEIGRRR
jgi:DNA mismatch repair protein MutL